MTSRPGRCVCGLRIALHFDQKNRKRSCEDARALHPRAHTKRAALAQQFARLVSTKEIDHGKA